MAAETAKPNNTAEQWRTTMLPELVGLPLLPCGAGATYKAPINPNRSGIFGLTGWESAAYTPEQIAGFNGKVICVGTRCGPDAGGLLVWDLDGRTAVEWLLARGCDPGAIDTWRITRTTSTERLKVAFRVPPELWPGLQELLGASGKTKLITKPRIGDAEDEQVELFWSTGQVVVAGAHKTSGGFYSWEGSPAAIADIPIPWWDALHQLIEAAHPQRAAAPLEQSTPAAPRAVEPVRDAASDTPPRPRDELERLVCEYPLIVADNGQREEARDLAAAFITTCEESGISAGEAVEILSKYHPQAADTFQQVLSWDFAGFGQGSFIARCKEAGVDVSRQDLKPRRGRPPGSGKGAAKQTKEKTPKQKKAESIENRRSARKTKALRHRLNVLERYVGMVAVKERNPRRRMAFLRHGQAALALKHERKEPELLQMLLEAVDDSTGQRYRAITAEERAAMEVREVEFVIPGLIPANEMTVIGGRSKTGKTRLVVDLVRAILRGEEALGLGVATTRPVILVTDDQGDADTKKMLDQHEIWLHPGLLWSRKFRATERELDQLAADIAANPGAVVIVDSLRSITRSTGINENEPQIGLIVLSIRQAVVDAGGTMVLIHHNNKADNNATGTEALSGHGSIPSNANTVATLHYMQTDDGKLLKDAPERRLAVEGRSTRSLDLVVSIRESGRFEQLMSFDRWQEQAAESRKQQREEAKQQKAEVLLPPLLRALLADQQKGGAGLSTLEICKAAELVEQGVRTYRDLKGNAITRYRQAQKALELAGAQQWVVQQVSGRGNFNVWAIPAEHLESVSARAMAPPAVA